MNVSSSMTQLIGVMCENKEKVLALSDRMVTTIVFTLAFEHETPKAEQITNNALALTAGTIHEPEIIRNTIEAFRGIDKPSIRTIAEKLSEEYSRIRLSRIESEILKRIGFQSISEYYENQKKLVEDIAFDIHRGIKDYKLGMTILLVGVDTEAHIYVVDNPGTWRSWDTLGFCCIGQGDRHAEPVFAYYGYTPNVKLQEALYIAYEAKKRSEMAGGIGEKTDVWIIDKSGIYKVEPETIQSLETIYRERNKSSRRDRFDRRIFELEIKQRKIEST